MRCYKVSLLSCPEVWQLCRTDSLHSQRHPLTTALVWDTIKGIPHISVLTWSTVQSAIARVPLKRIGYNAMIKIDERCSYKAKFCLRDISEYCGDKRYDQGTNFFKFRPILSRTVSRRCFIAKMTVSEENSGGIFGLSVEVWFGFPYRYGLGLLSSFHHAKNGFGILIGSYKTTLHSNRLLQNNSTF
jgi:hypothetical protein